jgi:hypothetical protein
MQRKLFVHACADCMQAVRLKQFVSKQRRQKCIKDGKAEWLLEHRTLALQAAELEHEMHTLLDGLHTSGHVPDDFHAACHDEMAVTQHLQHEEATEAKETAKHFRSVARALHAGMPSRQESDADSAATTPGGLSRGPTPGSGSQHPESSQHESDIEGFLHELASKSEVQWQAVRLLEEDAAALSAELRCAPSTTKAIAGGMSVASAGCMVLLIAFSTHALLKCPSKRGMCAGVCRCGSLVKGRTCPCGGQTHVTCTTIDQIAVNTTALARSHTRQALPQSLKLIAHVMLTFCKMGHWLQLHTACCMKKLSQ